MARTFKTTLPFVGPQSDGADAPPTASRRLVQTQYFGSFISLLRLGKTGLWSQKISLGDREHEDTTLLPEETGLRKSGKAQSNEMVIAQEEKQGQEKGNGQQRTKEMLWWETDRSSASTVQNKGLI